MAIQRAAQIFVQGRVQGVGFRHFAKQRAELHQIRGFVRNLVDGRVEVVGVGSRPAIKALIEDLQRGPPASEVQKCQIQWRTEPNFFQNFSIRL